MSPAISMDYYCRTAIQVSRQVSSLIGNAAMSSGLRGNQTVLDKNSFDSLDTPNIQYKDDCLVRVNMVGTIRSHNVQYSLPPPFLFSAYKKPLVVNFQLCVVCVVPCCVLVLSLVVLMLVLLVLLLALVLVLVLVVVVLVLSLVVPRLVLVLLLALVLVLVLAVVVLVLPPHYSPLQTTNQL